MSMYFEYLKEREDLDVIEMPEGFALFRVLDDGSLFVRDLYVRPEHRRHGITEVFFQMFLALAKKHESKSISCQVHLVGATASFVIPALIRRGFKVCGASNHILVLGLELNHG